MQQIPQVWPSQEGLLFQIAEPGGLVVNLEIDGRRACPSLSHT
jgi:hypothetical protein